MTGIADNNWQVIAYSKISLSGYPHPTLGRTTIQLAIRVTTGLHRGLLKAIRS